MPNRSLVPVLAFALTAGLFAAEEPEAPAGPEFSADLTAVSRYLWRGFVVNDSPSVQPSLTVAYRGVSVNFWSNVSQRPQRNQAWTESDITVEYARQLGRWTVLGGFADYQFVDTSAAEGNRSSEIYVGCSFAGRLSPSFRVYRDLEAGDGNYYSASVAKGFKLPRGLNAQTTVGIGLNQHQFQQQTTISNVESTTSVDVYNSERVLLAPFLTVTSGHRTLFGTHVAFGLRAVFER
jgi:uncharacterized protein (TIGR02001 family)